MSTTTETQTTFAFDPVQSASKETLVREQEALPLTPLIDPIEAPSKPLCEHDEAHTTITEAAKSLCPTQNALIVTAERKYQVVSDFPAPGDLAPDEVKIRNHAAGLNHIDWKSVEYNYCLPAFPWVTGREMSGVVEDVGSAVLCVKPGDRVWTSTYYKDFRAGCFQELVVVPQHTVFPIPSPLSFYEATSLGVPGATAAMTLWRYLDIPMPAGTGPCALSSRAGAHNCDDMMLIWGASSTTGQYVVQLAALSGIPTICVCSESTAPLVKSLGATHIVTYTGKPEYYLIGEILSVAAGRLTRAIDIVGPATAKVIVDLIRACGPEKMIDFVPLGFMAKDQLLPENVRLKAVEMKWFILDPTARVYGERLNGLLESGWLKVPKVRVLPGGVDAVEEGLEMVKKGSLAGDKLVVSFMQ